MKGLPESTMSLPLMTWLDGLGYVPYAEVGLIDIVAMKEPEPEMIAVEMKVGFSREVKYQASRALSVAERSYCAVLSNPAATSLKQCKELGIGVLRVHNGTVVVLLEAIFQRKFIQSWRRRDVICDLRQRVPGGVAGRPNLKGEGPAQECARRVRRYRDNNPDARWADVFMNVENHYASMESMRGALTSRSLV